MGAACSLGIDGSGVDGEESRVRKGLRKERMSDGLQELSLWQAEPAVWLL